MPSLTARGQSLSYCIEGEGFPLILVPDTGGTLRDWAPVCPLLGELCRVIAYEYAQQLPAVHIPSPPDRLVDDLVVFLHALGIARAYVAGYARGGEIALRLALRDPGRVEGLLIMSPSAAVRGLLQPEATSHTAAPTDRPPTSACTCLPVPTLVVIGADAATDDLQGVTRLAAQLPHGVSIRIPGAAAAPHREQPMPLGHAMLTFLMQCERQRTLVRGASFLL
jgi:pimeloyl-ACP methyl ester carboxylesterase